MCICCVLVCDLQPGVTVLRPVCQTEQERVLFALEQRVCVTFLFTWNDLRLSADRLGFREQVVDLMCHFHSGMMTHHRNGYDLFQRQNKTSFFFLFPLTTGRLKQEVHYFSFSADSCVILSSFYRPNLCITTRINEVKPGAEVPFASQKQFVLLQLKDTFQSSCVAAASSPAAVFVVLFMVWILEEEH